MIYLEAPRGAGVAAPRLTWRGRSERPDKRLGRIRHSGRLLAGDSRPEDPASLSSRCCRGTLSNARRGCSSGSTPPSWRAAAGGG